MAVFGKRGSGTGVLEAPTDTFAQTEWTTPEPAPAGMLQRKRAGRVEDEPGYTTPQDAEDVYKPKRASLRYKLKLGMPTSMAGRIVGATLLLIVAGAALASVLEVRAMLMHDPRFAIATSSEIELQGNKHLTRDQLLSVFGADLERNIFKVPLAQRQQDLERLPWVKQATVMRLLPNTVRVAVTERTPVAFVREGNQIGLVDAEGVLLDMPPDAAGDPRYSFPVLTGLTDSDPLSVRKARMEIYQKFMADLDAGATATKPSDAISEVDVSNPEDVKALIASGGTDILVHFGDENFLKRYQTFEQNLPQWKAQYPKLASVDTRYENQMVLEMARGSEAASQQAGDSSSQQAGPSAGQQSSESASQQGASAAAQPVKAPAKPVGKSVKPAVKAKDGKSSLSKQQIEAMLAAARKKPAKHGVSGQ